MACSVIMLYIVRILHLLMSLPLDHFRHGLPMIVLQLLITNVFSLANCDLFALHSSGKEYFILPITIAFVMIVLDLIVVCDVNFLMLYSLLFMFDVIFAMCLSCCKFCCII